METRLLSGHCIATILDNIENIHTINLETRIRIKTSPGRGGFVRHIFVNGMTRVNMKWEFIMTGSYGSHPNKKFNPNAHTEEDKKYRHMTGEN